MRSTGSDLQPFSLQTLTRSPWIPEKATNEARAMDLTRLLRQWASRPPAGAYWLAEAVKNSVSSSRCHGWVSVPSLCPPRSST